MAIEGDIDLTENLDFRLDKKLLPSKSVKIAKKEQEEMVSLGDMNTQLDILNKTRFKIHINSNDYYYDIISPSVTTNIVYEDDDFVRVNEYSYNWTTPYYNEWSSSTTYSSFYYDSCIESDSIPISFSYDYPIESSDKIFTLGNERRYKKEALNENNVFFQLGDSRIKKEERSPAIQRMYNEGQSGYYPDYLLYGWGYYNNDIIPWDDKDDEKDDYYQEKRKIPWLKKLGDRIYRDYIQDLFDEQDYSKYLTNYGWLGLH